MVENCSQRSRRVQGFHSSLRSEELHDRNQIRKRCKSLAIMRTQGLAYGCTLRGRHAFGSSDRPLAEQRSVMVAETGLKWQHDGKLDPLQDQNYVQSPRAPAGSPCLSVSLCAAGATHKCVHHRRGDGPVEGLSTQSIDRETLGSAWE